MVLARQLASKSPQTLAIGKEAFYLQADMTMSEAYSYATRVMIDNLATSDAQEGIGAFLDKRQPVWLGY
jgi:enoyl-CoA hydratase/carnithine racemase